MLANYFLQKINTMGFLNKIVSKNLKRIKTRANKASFVNTVGNDFQY
jgi:hypothetical protein